MQLSISVPQGYMHGAFHVQAKLEDEEVAAYLAWPISFAIPNLPKRSIVTRAGFIVAESIEGGIFLRGIFREGAFEADIYTNGIAEDENPTKINVVEKALKSSIEAAISSSMSIYRGFNK